MQNPIVRTSVLGYGGLLAASLVLAHWSGRLPALFEFPGWRPLLIRAFAGFVVAGVTLAGFEGLKRAFQWARELDGEFRLLLRPLRVDGALVVALSSGIAEEIFFRGLLQPALGLIAASLLFGAMHLPANRRMAPWTALAVLMGFVFGFIYDETGSLLTVIVAHVTINFAGLLEIANEKEGSDRFG